MLAALTSSLSLSSGVSTLTLAIFYCFCFSLVLYFFIYTNPSLLLPPRTTFMLPFALAMCSPTFVWFSIVIFYFLPTRTKWNVLESFFLRLYFLRRLGFNIDAVVIVIIIIAVVLASFACSRGLSEMEFQNFSFKNLLVQRGYTPNTTGKHFLSIVHKEMDARIPTIYSTSISDHHLAA